MSAREVNLLPVDVRDRTERQVRSGRYVAAVAVASAVVAALAAHARIDLAGARSETERVRAAAALVFAEEERIAALDAEIGAFRDARARYRRIALPLETARLVSTISAVMPAGTTLERLDLDARPPGLRRGRGPEPASADGPRRLRGELSGFAPDDRAIARLVQELQARPPFEDVSLDFSRSRLVRERPARAFRLSFQVDLSAVYDVDLVAPSGLASVESAGEVDP